MSWALAFYLLAMMRQLAEDITDFESFPALSFGSVAYLFLTALTWPLWALIYIFNRIRNAIY